MRAPVAEKDIMVDGQQDRKRNTSICISSHASPLSPLQEKMGVVADERLSSESRVIPMALKRENAYFFAKWLWFTVTSKSLEVQL